MDGFLNALMGVCVFELDPLCFLFGFGSSGSEELEEKRSFVLQRFTVL